MSLSGILFYTGRAVAFALPLALPLALLVCGVRLLVQKKQNRAIRFSAELLRFLFLFYLLSLIEITAIRDGAHLTDFWLQPHSADTLQLIPLVRTLQMAQGGAWAILYPVLGNLIWFLPLGVFSVLLFPRCRLWQIALLSFSVSFGIELLQWLFISGISDIDDLLFNLLGGLSGYGLGRLWQHCRKKPAAAVADGKLSCR